MNFPKTLFPILAVGLGAILLGCLVDEPAPALRLRPAAFSQSYEQAKVGGYVAPDGEEIQCFLPEQFHIKNRGGSDGAGLCVWDSLNYCCVFQHVRPLDQIFKWHFDKPGGGWPERVDKDIAAICQEQGVPVPDYIQVEDKDNRRTISQFTKTGRMVGATYCFSLTGRYEGKDIAHMIAICHCTPAHGNSPGWVGVLDNNYPRSIEWIPYDDFPRVHAKSGQGWIVGFLNPGPPPVPHN